jgi:hypothetical protein
MKPGLRIEIISLIHKEFKRLLADRPRKEDEKAPDVEGNASKEHKETPRKVFPCSHVDPSPPRTNEANDKRYSSSHWWKSTSFEQVKSSVEFAAYFFAIAYAIITYFQWRDAGHDFKIDQRAWVAPSQICQESPGVTPPSGSDCMERKPQDRSITYKVLFRNYGKTFATNIRSYIAFGRSLERRSASPSAKDLPPRGILAPNGLFNMSVPRPVATSELAKYGDETIYVTGKVWYDDIFGKQHWIEFCYSIPANEVRNAFASCDTNNGCDECISSK